MHNHMLTDHKQKKTMKTLLTILSLLLFSLTSFCQSTQNTGLGYYVMLDDNSNYLKMDSLIFVRDSAFYPGGETSIKFGETAKMVFTRASYKHNVNAPKYIMAVDSFGVLKGQANVLDLPVSTATQIAINSKVTTISAPGSSTSITSGTAFQPRSGGPSEIIVNSALTGAVGLNGSITIAMSSSSGGTYNTISSDALGIYLLGIGGAKSTGTIPVPSGYWVKVTYTGGITGSYIKWDF